MANILKETKGKFDRSVIAFAFLAQATRGEGDLLSGLAPIFKPIAKIHAGEKFDAKEFSNIVDNLYGLKVHPWAVDDLIPRLEESGMITRIQYSKEIHEYVYAEINEEFNDVTENDIKQAIRRFIEFSTPILNLNQISIDGPALEEAFLSKLVDMNFLSILIKPDRSKEDSRKTNTLSVKKPKEQKDWEEENSAHSKIDVLCASFIVDAYHKDPDLYDLIMRIATGAVLSEVILNLQDPGQTTSLKGLHVILDAPFLMSTLNLASEESYKFALEICNQLREKEAKLVTFDHSIDELKNNLTAVISNSRDGVGFGPTSKRLKNPGFATYVASILQNIDTILKQENINQINVPKIDSYFQFFTQKDQIDFQQGLGFYQNKRAQERDAESIASTIRLRRGKQVKMGRLPTAGYLFVTENSWVASCAQSFLKRRNLFNDGEVPPAVTEKYLAGLLWVLYGGKGKELTRHLLLANCAAALEPRSDVITQMYRFLSNVDSKQAEFFNTLMTEERAGQYVMQLTLGDSAFINQDNAPIVLEHIKRSLIEKHEESRKAEIKLINDSHQEELGNQARVAEKLRQELLDSNAESMQTRNELNETSRKVAQLESDVQLERKERLEEKRRLVEKCVRSAIKYEKGIYFVAGTSVSTIISLITWFGLLNTQALWIKSVLSIFLWALGIVFFWKVPDFVLAGYVHKLRENKFRESLHDLGIYSDAKLFDIDWKSKRVLAKVNAYRLLE